MLSIFEVVDLKKYVFQRTNMNKKTFSSKQQAGKRLFT
jgi:hypothetical protein